MVFNSHEFIVVFLPLAFVAVALAHRIGGWNLAFGALGVASLAFYANWGAEFLGILVVSILSNYVIANIIVRSKDNKRQSLAMLVFGIAGNLVALGFFKYTNFFLDVMNQTAGTDYSHWRIILPIGISFYTFIQIGYLVDAHCGLVKNHSLMRYVTFSSFFPCVTAGPLILQREMMGQMEDRTDEFLDPRRIAAGLAMFTMGLFKKVVFADNIAVYSDTVFNGVAGGMSVDMMTAWAGALAYTLQLYFDFSGYSDMALGIAAVFGLVLPLNFNSPFKATSISDFWQRWHMSMTRFFTNYVYSPMAMKGMRQAMAGQYSPVAKYILSGGWPIVFTMLVAGIWHGSGWVFVIYGLLHGFAIAINNAWKFFKMPAVPPMAGWGMTMAVVVSGLVIFRSPDVVTAMTILKSMFGLGLYAPEASPYLYLAIGEAVPLIMILGVIVLVAPNTQEIMSRYWYSTSPIPAYLKEGIGRLSWRPRLGWAVAMAPAFVIAFSLIGTDSSFLYYKF